jgi:hypothetical protein
MKKIRLRLEALNVISFHTSNGVSKPGGTVQGHSVSGASWESTCTYGASCVGRPCKTESLISQCIC